jgi:tetratricopeptide (TPR) repeat protein
MKTGEHVSLSGQYTVSLDLYNEYKSFNYDEAFYYARQLQRIGLLLNDPYRISLAKIKFGFILLSSGMFKETFDTLRTVEVPILPDSVRKEYYFLNARTYYDLADFDRDQYYAPLYTRHANSYVDSALALSKPNSFEYLYYTGLKFVKSGRYPEAIQQLSSLIVHFPLNDHQFAIAASTLSDLYIRKSDEDSAIHFLVLAAMADIRSSTKEAAAMLNLAQLLHKKRENQKASAYIKAALEDAVYYGARQRKIQIGDIFPLIDQETIHTVEVQRRLWVAYALFFTVLSVTVLIFAFIIYKQLRKLKAADKVIMQTNRSLEETIKKLDEADHIKDEYIGYYFNLISVYVNKLEHLKRSIDNKLTTKRYEDIRTLINNIDLNKEREELLANFDRAFLKIFPNFVEDFNSFFSGDHQVHPAANQLLTTDIRIFALIRLGVTSSEKIANILDYSVNTIYNYRTRIKNKSIIAKDDFEEAVMAIKAF